MTDKGKVFKTECEGDTLIVIPIRPISELAEEYVNEELQALCTRVGDGSLTNVVIDLSMIENVTSAVLEVMLALWRQVSAKESKMAVCNTSIVGLQVIQISRFDQMMSICESRSEALQAVQS